MNRDGWISTASDPPSGVLTPLCLAQLASRAGATTQTLGQLTRDEKVSENPENPVHGLLCWDLFEACNTLGTEDSSHDASRQDALTHHQTEL